MQRYNTYSVSRLVRLPSSVGMGPARLLIHSCLYVFDDSHGVFYVSEVISVFAVYSDFQFTQISCMVANVEGLIAGCVNIEKTWLVAVRQWKLVTVFSAVITSQ